LSAKTEIKDIRKGMDLGADDYLTKPVEEELLLSAIESRLAKSELLQEALILEETVEETENTYEDIKNVDDLKNYFCDFGTSKLYKKGEAIYKENENSNYVYLIYKGKVKGIKIDEFGKELIITILKDDELFGFSAIFDNSRNYESTITMEQTEIMVVPKKTLQEILKNNYTLSLDILHLVNDHLSEVKDQLLQMAYGSMRRKTASTILKFANKMRSTPTNSINICRRDLASVAGIATESLIRTLTDLKKEGVIEIEGRNIKIIDLEKLESIY
jgi:CRP-like cAMP-binding protein